MRQLKMAGLVVLAMAATLVVFGGSAAATTLCKENAIECPVGMRYPEKETILANLVMGSSMSYEGLGAKGELFLIGSCQESSLSWSTTENRGPGKILNGTVTSLLFGKCKNGAAPCEKVTAQNLAYGAELLPGAFGAGSLFLVNGATGARKIKFENCLPFGANCVYEPTEMRMDITGGSPATITTFVWEFKAEGGNPLCGVKIKMSGKYETAAPKVLWVSQKP